MNMLSLALVAGTLALAAATASAQAEATRAQVKSDTAQALRKGQVAPSAEVDPENQKLSTPARASGPGKATRAARKASSGASGTR